MKRMSPFLLSSILIMMSMIIASCQPAAPPMEEETPPIDTPEETVPDPEEVVEIIFMRFSEGHDVELELIDEFNANHPNIRVVADTVPAVDTYPKLVLTTEAREAPDVFLTYWTVGAASHGLAMELEPFIEREGGEWFSNLSEQGWVFHTFAGAYYAVPWRVAPGMVIINSYLLEKSGLPLPPPDWTWDDYIEYAAAMTDVDNDEWGICQMGSSEDPGTDYQFYTFLFSGGAKMINEEGLAGFNTPEGVAALEFMVDFIESYMVPPGTTAATANVCHDLLAADKAGSWIDASLWSGIIRTIQPEADITIVPMPVGQRAATVIGGTGLGMSAYTEHPDEAWEFIKFMVSDDVMLRWSTALGFTPPNLSLLEEHPTFVDDPEQQRVAWVMQNQKLYPLSGYPSNAELESILRSYLQAAYLGQITPAEALERAEAEWNPILTRFQEDEWWDAWLD